MLTCRNQSCGAQWALADVTIKNEGQGDMFRCVVCGARNPVTRRVLPDGTVVVEEDRAPRRSSS